MKLFERAVGKTWVLALLVAAISVGVAQDASAAFKLRLDDASTGAIDLTVADGDLNGEISSVGALPAFSFNSVGGFSKGIAGLGSATSPRLDMVSVNISPAAGTLHLYLTDTDFSGTGLGMAVASIGGTTDGKVTYEAFWDPGNAEFATTHKIGITQTFGPGGINFPFSGLTSELGIGDSAYSLTLHVIIAHTGSARKATSFNAALGVFPEPATTALLGVGLAGFAVVRRRLKKRTLSTIAS